MDWVNVIGLDPAIANFGIVRARIFIGGTTLIATPVGKVLVERLRLIQTDGQAGKTVRKSSDDLRRAQEIATVLDAEIKAHGAKFVISEIPSGAKSARAAFLLGAALGILASLQYPIIQVNPIQTKMVSVGTKTASKQEMIDWAVGKFPAANWLYDQRGKRNNILKANEHLADAIAVVHAGVETQEFKQAIALLRSIAA